MILGEDFQPSFPRTVVFNINSLWCQISMMSKGISLQYCTRSCYFPYFGYWVGSFYKLLDSVYCKEECGVSVCHTKRFKFMDCEVFYKSLCKLYCIKIVFFFFFFGHTHFEVNLFTNLLDCTFVKLDEFQWETLIHKCMISSTIWSACNLCGC